MNETPLEKLESIDMLRILENGYKIKNSDNFRKNSICRYKARFNKGK